MQRDSPLVDRHDRACSSRLELLRESTGSRRPTLLTASDLPVGVVQKEAAEIDRQVVLEAAKHDLEDAGQILPLADGPGDVLQQTQSASCRCSLLSDSWICVEHLIEGVGEQVELQRAAAVGANGVVVAIRNRAGRIGQRKNGSDQMPLQAARRSGTRAARDGGDQQRDQRIQLHALTMAPSPISRTAMPSAPRVHPPAEAEQRGACEAIPVCGLRVGKLCAFALRG